MVKVTIEYQGNLRCKGVHEPSKQEIYTDAPLDNGGKGELFSPTDLVGAALASCIATIMGIYAKKKGWDFTGMRLEVNKTMTTEGVRRIKELPVEIWVPIPMSTEEQTKLTKAAHTCPVHMSLHPDISAPIIFHWKE